MPRGGARLGAGRPRKDRGSTWLAGNPGKRGPRAVERPNAAEASATAVKRPSDLSAEERAVWDELAPLALEVKTLTATTAMAFADLCAFIVLERKMRIAPLAVGGPDHRGMVSRVEALRARFRLVPDGKPIVADEAPKDEWAEFDGPTLVRGAAG